MSRKNLMVFLSMAISVSAQGNTCGGPNGLLAKLVENQETIFARLPEDIKVPMQTAIESQLGIGALPASESSASESMTHWSLDALYNLRFMGIPEEEISKKITARLDQFLRQGRREGLSKPISLPQLLTGPAPKTPTVMRNFYEKYDLASVNAKLKLLGSQDARAYYRVGTETAFTLAIEIHNLSLASEIFVHMLRAGDYERAYKAAEMMPESDKALYSIGLFAISRFYHQSASLNYISDAIEALKRVQGPLKAEAEQLLTDLAKELISPEMIKSLSADDPVKLRLKHAEYALRALRVTGKLVGKVALDSIQVDFITEVADPVRVKLIQNIADIIVKETKGERSGAENDQVLLALTSIKDTVRLDRLGEVLFANVSGTEERRQKYIYEKAFEYFFAAGNFKRAHDVLQEETDHMGIDLFGIRINTLRSAVKIGAMDIVAKIKAHAEKPVPANTNSRDAGEILQDVRAIAAGTYKEPLNRSRPLTPAPRGEYIFKHAVESEIRVKAEIEKYKAELTPEKRSALIQRGNELVDAKDYWNAYQIYSKALYRPGLLQVASLMTTHGDGLNAISPLMYAALLPLENSIEGAANVPLLR